MRTLFQTSQISDFSVLKEKIIDFLKKLPSSISIIGTSEKILRYEFSCKKMNNLDWLQRQDVDQKFYWGDRSGDWEMAGVGVAHVVTGKENPHYKSILTTLQTPLSADNPDLRYYGGFQFSQSLSLDETWKNFNAYRFVIPRFEFIRKEQSCTFAINIALNEINNESIDNILSEFKYLKFTTSSENKESYNILSREDFPNKNDWDDLFNDVQSQLNSKTLEKVVLARKTILNFSQMINPFTLIEKLKKNTTNCFHFCFSPHKDKAFLGASPERLYKRVENSIETEAIAGTRIRGKTKEEDDHLSNELLHSAKDAKEHQYVVDFIKKSLNSLCSSLNKSSKPQILKLNGGYHLITPFHAELKNSIKDHEILSQLHPTPAVAGTPQKEALDFINKKETFDRGLYAAPVGYVGYHSTEFIVAIRSGLVQKKQLSLYAGAGIVSESDCEKEWLEIENKMENFLKIFKPSSEKIYV